MTNDLSTLSGALLEMKDQLIYELGQKGVTASYSSTDGLLGLIGKISEIQTGGGSCYHIELDESTYTTSGSLTVTAYLQSNYEPLANATVTFTGGSSTVTATTDSSGIATATVSFSQSGTLTASYSNVSDTATVTIISYLFQDSCATNNTSDYTTQGSCSITYNSSGYYVLKKTNYGSGTAGVKVNNITVPKNVKITADIKLNTTSNTQAQFVVLNGASGTGYGGRLSAYSGGELGIITGTLTSSISGLSATRFTVSTSIWYTMEFIVNDNSLTLNLYDGSNLLYTVSATGSISLSDSNNFGFAVANDRNNNFNIKNIMVEAI